MNELELHDAADPAGGQGLRRIQDTGATHRYAGACWAAVHDLGYEHLFTHQVVDLARAIAGDGVAAPSFAEAALVQRVLAAVEASAHADSTYVTVEGSPS